MFDAIRVTGFDPTKFDGQEIGPCRIIGDLTWHKNEWRALAEYHGALVVIALQVRVVGDEKDHGLPSK